MWVWFFSSLRLCKCLLYSQKAQKRDESTFYLSFSLNYSKQQIHDIHLQQIQLSVWGNSSPPVVPSHSKDSSFLWLLSCLCNEARGEASWNTLRVLVHVNWPQGHASRDLTIPTQKSKGHQSSAPSAQVSWKFVFHSKFHIMDKVLKLFLPSSPEGDSETVFWNSKN